MNELTPQQIGVIEHLIAQGFVPVAFPLYASLVGVRKGSCAALLNPVTAGGFQIYGEPCPLLDGNMTVRITENGKAWFVWKKQRLEATAERVSELNGFVSELKLLLEFRV